MNQINELNEDAKFGENTNAHTVVLRYGREDDEDHNWKYGLAWKPVFEIGDAKIDNQHKKLFRLTSDLIEALLEGRQDSILSDALDFLAAYTVQHFTDEEALQLKVAYPNYEAHKKMHEEFTAAVVAFINAFKAGEREGLPEKVNSLVARWLINHVKNEDAKIGEYI